ncbi:MAG: PLP-dependent transferase [Chloroflexi bacterium]|nr:PLP-dependent transferase [Chloroflexota bacterium]
MPIKSIYTLAVHAGERGPISPFRPVTTSIHPSVGYLAPSMEDLDAVFGGEREGYVYQRYANPTVNAFEQAVAALEGGEAAVAYASGMAAVHGALLSALMTSGRRALVSASDVYGATYAVQAGLLSQLEVQTTFVDITDLNAVAEAVSATKPAALICEILSNPLLKVADVPRLAEIAHSAGAALIVDNTFATPYLFRPLEHGADYVLHSATKYLAGHGDVLAGVIVCSAERARDLRARQILLGANLGPQEAWLALRGLKTLALRLRQQCANGQVVAEWLAAEPRVAQVHYPGLATHPQHELAGRLFGSRGYGGMMSFALAGARRADIFRFMEALELVLPATTLGDVHSLMLYPAHSSHRALPPEMREALGIGEGLVRLSVGIEDADDILQDLKQAMEKI